jgi:hypothetical protein
MAIPTDLQKRKRADTVLDEPVLEVESDTEEFIVVYDPRYGLPSFRFMDAYRKGLSVKATAWCVRKQSRHRTISEQANEGL